MSKTRGFTLLETMIAMIVLGVGVLGLAALLGDSLAYMNSAQADFIAQQKAAEAVEAVFTARDTQAVTWAGIQNVSNGGIFLDGAQTMLDPGTDGLVGTAADANASQSTIIMPGPDGILGTADDIVLPLSTAYQMTRTIAITSIVNESSVRQIQVTVNYRSGRFKKSYTLTTFISQYS
jgi:type IV pilus modification protein PilV